MSDTSCGASSKYPMCSPYGRWALQHPSGSERTDMGEEQELHARERKKQRHAGNVGQGGPEVEAATTHPKS